jgi:hypothetical protein
VVEQRTIKSVVPVRRTDTPTGPTLVKLPQPKLPARVLPKRKRKKKFVRAN